MKIADATESGSLADWLKVLDSINVAWWTNNDCTSVVLAVTANHISEADAKKNLAKTEKKSFATTQKRLSRVFGQKVMDRMMQAPALLKEDSKKSSSESQ